MGRWAKKRAKEKSKSLKNQVYDKTLKMYQDGQGRSKFQDKKDGLSGRFIYSSSTFQTYKKEGKLFCTWIEKEHPEVRQLKDAEQYVNSYLEYLIKEDFSPWSISTKKAALSKIFQVPAGTFMDTPTRERAKIKRSRYESSLDKNISKETENYYSKITSATGLRRAELLKITGDSLYEKDGKYFIRVEKGTKGGRPRVAEIIGKDDAETQEIVNLFREKGKLRVVSSVPKHLDNHYYRGQYAKKVYNRYARPEDYIPQDKKYVMRKDRAGEVLDRDAMLITSRYLGHNRVDVIAQSYLY
jgi:integrase